MGKNGRSSGALSTQRSWVVPGKQRRRLACLCPHPRDSGRGKSSALALDRVASTAIPGHQRWSTSRQPPSAKADDRSAQKASAQRDRLPTTQTGRVLPGGSTPRRHQAPAGHEETVTERRSVADEYRGDTLYPTFKGVRATRGHRPLLMLTPHGERSIGSLLERPVPMNVSCHNRAVADTPHLCATADRHVRGSVNVFWPANR